MAGGRDLAQSLQGAWQEFALTAEFAKLSKFNIVISDDNAHAAKNLAESSVMFELIAARYECLSIATTAIRWFGQWDEIFPGSAMTVATIDRLVHHAVLFEMNVESYRRRQAQTVTTGADASQKRNARQQSQEERKEGANPSP